MRGMAALFVVLFHVSKVYPLANVRGGYLAVDMFFALSGFVIARSNDARFKTGMTATEFMCSRLVRLYPLYFVGILLGSLALLLEPNLSSAPTETWLGAILPNLLMLPSFYVLDGPRLFATNEPAWSLFCEFWIANLLYALLWKRISPRSICVVILLSLLALICVELHFYTIDVGSLRGNTVGGLARVAFSFSVGIALWRIYLVHQSPFSLPPWVILTMLAMLLSLPLPNNDLMRLVHELVCVAAGFPALIYLGAGAKTGCVQISAMTGGLSYALYITHVPLLLIWSTFVPTQTDWSFAEVLSYLSAAIVLAITLDRTFDPYIRSLLPPGGVRASTRERGRSANHNPGPMSPS